MAEDRATRMHNDGQADRGSGAGYNPPHGAFDQLTTWSDSGMKQIAADNGAYSAGWHNSDTQIKENKSWW